MHEVSQQKGLAHILLIIILITGVLLGVYLTGKTQIFRPKAQVSEVTAVEIYTSASGTDRILEPTGPRPQGPVYLQIKELKW